MGIMLQGGGDPLSLGKLKKNMTMLNDWDAPNSN